MLGKNNFKERLRKMEEQNKRERFSIRKLSIGAASVLIGFAFMGLSSSTVLADPLVPTSEPQTAKSETDNQGNNVPEETPQFAGNGMQNNDQTGTAAQSNKKNSQAPAANEQKQSEQPAQPAKNNVGQTPAKTSQDKGQSKAGQNLNNSLKQADTATDQTVGSATDQATQSKPGAASNKSKTLDEAVASLQKAMDQASDYEEKIEANQSLTDVQKKQLAQIDDAMMSGQALLDKYNAKKLEGQTIAGIVRSNPENSDNRGHGSGLQGFDLNQFGDLAGQLGGLLNSFLYVPGQATQDVNNWSDLRSAIEDNNVTTINLNSDIITNNDLSYGVHNRSLVINGNYHTLTVNNNPLLNFTGNVVLKNINISIGSGSSLFNQAQINGNPSQLTFMGKVTVINPKGLAAHDIVLSKRSTLNMEYVGSASTAQNQRNDLCCNNLTLEENSTLNDGSDTALADNGSIDVAKDINVAAGANFNVNSVGRDIQFSILATTDNTLNVAGSVNLKSTSGGYNGSINGWKNITINVADNGKLNIDIPGDSFWNIGIGGPLNLNANSGSTVTITEKGQAQQPLRITADNPKLFDLKASNTGFSDRDPLHISSDSVFRGKNVGILLKAKERSGAWKISSINGTIGSGIVEYPEGIKFSTPVTSVDAIPSIGLASSNLGLSPESWYGQLGGSNNDFSEIKMTSDLSNFGVDTDAKRFAATSSTVILHVKDSLQVSPEDVLRIKDSEGNIGDISTSSNWPGTSDKILDTIKWVDGLYNNQGKSVGKIDASGNITLNSGVIDFAGRPSSDGNVAATSTTHGTAGGTANILVTYEDGTTDTVPVQIDLIAAQGQAKSYVHQDKIDAGTADARAKASISNSTALEQTSGHINNWRATSYQWADASGSVLTGTDLDNLFKNNTDADTVTIGGTTYSKAKAAYVLVTYKKPDTDGNLQPDGTQLVEVPLTITSDADSFTGSIMSVSGQKILAHVNEAISDIVPGRGKISVKDGHGNPLIENSNTSGVLNGWKFAGWVKNDATHTALTNSDIDLSAKDLSNGAKTVSAYANIELKDGSHVYSSKPININIIGGYSVQDSDATTLNRGEDLTTSAAKTAVKNLVANNGDLDQFNAAYAWATGSDGPDVTTSSNGTVKHANMVISYFKDAAHTEADGTQIVSVPYKVQDNTENDSTKPTVNSDGLTVHYGQVVTTDDAIGMIKLGNSTAYLTPSEVGTGHTVTDVQWVTSLTNGTVIIPNTDQATAGQGSTDVAGYIKVTYIDGSSKILAAGIHVHAGYNNTDKSYTLTSGTQPSNDDAKNAIKNSAAGAIDSLSGYNVSYKWAKDADGTAMDDAYVTSPTNVNKHAWVVITYTDGVGARAHTATQIVQVNDLSIKSQVNSYTIKEITGGLNSHAVDSGSPDVGHLKSYFTVLGGTDGTTDESSNVTSAAWKDEPNWTTAGDKTGTVTLTFADGSTKDVTLDVHLVGANVLDTTESTYRNVVPTEAEAKGKVTNAVTDLDQYHATYGWYSDDAATTALTASDVATATVAGTPKIVYLAVKYYKDAAHTEADGQQVITMQLTINNSSSQYTASLNDTSTTLRTHVNAPSTDFTNWSDWITLKKTSDSSTIDLSTIGTASNPIRSIEWATAPNTAESADSSQTAVAKITFADSTLTDPDVLEVNVPVTVAKATAKSDIETNQDSPLTAKDEISNLITLSPTTGEFKVGDSDVTWASDNTGSALASDFWTTNSDSSTAVDPVSGTRTSGKKGAYLIVHYKKSDGSSDGTQAIWVAVKIKSDADNIGGVTFDTAHGSQVTTHANATSADNNAENEEEVPGVHQKLVIYIGKDGRIVKKAYITVGKGYQSLEQLLKLARAKDKMPRGYKATGKARKVAKHLDVWVSKSGQSGNKKAPRTKDVLYVTKDGKIVKRTRITGSVGKQAKQHLPKGYKMTGLSRVHNHYDIWVKKSRK